MHIELRTAELIRRGMPPDAARLEAERRFGDRHRIQAQLEQIERKRGGRLRLSFAVEELWQDIRYGLRGLIRRPGFTVATASSLALGIAAVTVDLSIVDSWLLRPLPVPRPQELVVIGGSTKIMGSLVFPAVGMPTIHDLQGRKDLFQDVAGFRLSLGGVREAGEDRGEVRFFLFATGNYFSVLGIPPTIGRTISADDDARQERVAVLNHRFWVTHFAGDPGVLGRILYINRTPFTIIGVALEGFRGTEQMLDPDAFVPAGAEGALYPENRDLATRREGNYQLVARRRTDRTVPELQANLDILSKQLEATYPQLGEGYRLMVFPEMRARPTISAGSGVVIASVVFTGLALLVLLAACINATSLGLARATTRWTELTVRQALGASRGRLIRQLLTENFVVALLGLCVAWLLARLAVGWLRSVPLPSGLPITLGIEFDARIFAWAGLITLVAGFVAGIGPAFVGSRFDLQRGLKEGGRGGQGRRGGRIRAGLVVAQVAAATVVLICAGLFRSSMQGAANIDLGLDVDNVLTFEVSAALAGYDQSTARRAWDRAELAVKAIPSVRAVAWANAVPLSHSQGDYTDVYADNAPPTATKTGAFQALTSTVGPGYFDVLGIPLLEGRAFTTRDDTASAPVAIVNQRAAHTLWPGKSPIGQIIRLARGGPAITIVGVVKTGRYVIIGESPRPYVYLPLAQRYSPEGFMVIRTAGEPAALIPAIRRTFASIDKDLAPFAFSTMRELVGGFNGLLPLRLGAVIASAVGFLALVLAVVGLYGVIAYSVTQRTQEIGVRLALGADHGVVIRAILVQGGTLAGLGIALGVAGALVATRALGGLLISVSVTDRSVFGTVVVGLLLAALGSAYLPARRAARLDPVKAMRSGG